MSATTPMEAQPRPVFLTTSRISLQKPVFILVPVTSKEDMSEYGLFPPIVNIFRYVKCKFKVSRTIYSVCCCACQLLIFNLLSIKILQYISSKIQLYYWVKLKLIYQSLSISFSFLTMKFVSISKLLLNLYTFFE